MAAISLEPAAGSATAPRKSINSTATKLYEKCADVSNKRTDAIFYQVDLAAFGIAENNDELKELCEHLTQKHLFQVLIEGGQLCWRIRTKESADILINLSPDQRMLYTQIEATGSSGIWVKTLKTKTNLAQTIVNKALKQLESQRLIKEIKSAKYQGRRIWMLYNLDPSEENTGGTFFSDGKIDEGLIGGLTEAVNYYIRNETWREAKRPTKLGKKAGPSSSKTGAHAGGSATNNKRKRDGESPELPRYKPMLNSRGRELVPPPPSFISYPTPATVAHFLNSSGVIKDLSISIDDTKKLLEKMTYDGTLARMDSGYMTVKTVPDWDEEGEGNGLTSAPCGSCPVFSVCAPGNVISAETCEYFDEWLKW